MKELALLERLLQRLSVNAMIKQLAVVSHAGKNYPIHSVIIGPEDKSLPTFGIFGGIHGVERVGTHLAIKFLEGLYRQFQWDASLQFILKNCRIVSIPLVNPGGMAHNYRSNPRGVDIMRNAPINAEGSCWPVSGHRISPIFPWYRGKKNEPMELETQTLVDFVKEEMFDAEFAMAVDLHSGFGAVDRLWFPYGRTRATFPDLKTVKKIKSMIDENQPYHVYKIEPQSDSYLIHGDVWDYLYDQHYQWESPKGKKFIPWTLEMGSWNWLKKNPMQLFSFAGYFNPIVPHRYKRIMRRHRSLLDFLLRLTFNYQSWRKQQ